MHDVAVDQLNDQLVLNTVLIEEASQDAQVMERLWAALGAEQSEEARSRIAKTLRAVLLGEDFVMDPKIDRAHVSGFMIPSMDGDEIPAVSEEVRKAFCARLRSSGILSQRVATVTRYLPLRVINEWAQKYEHPSSETLREHEASEHEHPLEPTSEVVQTLEPRASVPPPKSRLRSLLKRWGLGSIMSFLKKLVFFSRPPEKPLRVNVEQNLKGSPAADSILSNRAQRVPDYPKDGRLKKEIREDTKPGNRRMGM